MGKKRQKVNWVTVDGLHWTGTEEADTPQSDSPAVQVKGGKERAGSRRTSGQGWSTSVVAPRFEKKVVPSSTPPPPPPPPACLTTPDCGDSQPKHIYYDGELCEAETLPNGFTKIRSKNLDILFKREYYEQRLATQKQLSEELKKAEAEKTPPETGSESCNDSEIISEKDPMDPMDPPEPAEVVEHSESQTLDKIDPDEIREFKPMNHGLETQTPVAAEPGHGYSQLSSMEELSQDAFINQRPNLYLYSPSNNTLIPCEEIIIPNPVLSPESGEPVYTGPTNIYLAYPVQGPDGRSYITQPFPIHGDPAYNTAYNGYSPSVSYDGSNYYSSTPHTPSSGEDSGSGSSTQPTSPPPLVNYHPSNWFKEQHGGGGVGSDYSCLEYNYPTKLPASHHHNHPAPAPSGGGAGVSAEKINLRDNSSRLNSNSSSSTSPCLPAGGGTDQPGNTVTVTYIPGLPQEEITQSSKSQKKRKKKSKPKQEKSNSAPDNNSIQSSSLQFELDIPTGKVEEANSEESAEQQSVEAVVEDKTENVFEIQLTDDLADSLVNPPTDTEVVVEENIIVKTPPPISVENGEGVDEELKINSEETSDTINTSKAVKKVKNEVKIDLNSEDREICEITDQISTRKIENSTKFANTLDNEELNSNCKNLTESDDNLNKNVLSTNPEMSKKGARNEKKMKQKKQKRGLKVVPNSEDGQNKCSNNIEPEADNNSDAASGKLKLSYSSVIKSNLQSAAPAGPAAPGAAGTGDKTETNELLGSDEIPPEKAEKEVQPPARNKSKTKTRLAGRRDEKAPIVRSDSWENIPPSVVQQEELTWEKTSKKRKQRNKSQVQTALQTRPDQSDVVGQEEEVAVMEVDKKVIESKQARQKTPDSEPIKESGREEREHSESVAREEEGDSEKRKMKKKKKKHESEECEDASSVHRVLICDDQLLQQYTREIRKAKDVLAPTLVEKVSSDGFCDVLYVSELGSGIHRGAMGFGRLFQGKYVPPERSDIVGDIAEDGDDKTEDGDEKSDHDNDQTTEVNEAELELCCNQSASEADIDLD